MLLGMILVAFDIYQLSIDKYLLSRLHVGRDIYAMLVLPESNRR